MNETVTSKPAVESEVLKTEIVFPDDTNPMGVLNGGRLIQWMDTACAICAQLHTGLVCVTAAVDAVKLEAPAKLGDIVRVRAKVTRAFRTSLEIRAEAEAQRTSEHLKFLVSRAYFTFVALSAGQGTAIAALSPIGEEEAQEYAAALARREARLSRKG